MAISGSMNPKPPQLPIELYRHVVAHVLAGADLANLCSVSSTLRFEAERLLYHTVEVLEHNRVMSWSATIASSPHLADIVHSITLPISTYTAPPIDNISQALHQTKNLKYLSLKPLIHNATSPAPIARYICVQIRMLIGCGFRLHGLSGELYTSEAKDLWQFLSEQPDIRRWSAGHSVKDHLSSLPDRILPNLAELELPMPSMLAHFSSRPIERVSIHIPWAFPDGTEQLSLFRDTLTYLTCRVEWLPSLILVKDHIASIAERVPNIKFLHYNAFVAVDSVRLFKVIS
jgi:hypothetical protein